MRFVYSALVLMIALAVLMAGCTVQDPKAASKEEVATAFQERDAALYQLALAIKELQEKTGLQKKEVKKKK